MKFIKKHKDIIMELEADSLADAEKIFKYMEIEAYLIENDMHEELKKLYSETSNSTTSKS